MYTCVSPTAAGPNAINPGTMLPHPEPVIIDETLSQNTFSTFCVQDTPIVATDNRNDDNCDHLVEKKGVAKTNSLHKDGLEESHSSFSTFSVPADQESHSSFSTFSVPANRYL